MRSAQATLFLFEHQERPSDRPINVNCFIQGFMDLLQFTKTIPPYERIEGVLLIPRTPPCGIEPHHEKTQTSKLRALICSRPSNFFEKPTDSSLSTDPSEIANTSFTSRAESLPKTPELQRSKSRRIMPTDHHSLGKQHVALKSMRIAAIRKKKEACSRPRTHANIAKACPRPSSHASTSMACSGPYPYSSSTFSNSESPDDDDGEVFPGRTFEDDDAFPPTTFTFTVTLRGVGSRRYAVGPYIATGGD